MSRARLRPRPAAERGDGLPWGPPVDAWWAAPALQVSLAFAIAALAVAVAGLAGDSRPGPQVVFAVAFAVALPAGWLGGSRLAARAAAPRLLASAAAAGLLAVVVGARLVEAAGGSASLALLLGLVGWAGAVALLAWRPGRRAPIRAVVLAGAALVPAAVVCFLPDRLLRPGPLAISLAGALAVAILVRREPSVALPRRVGGLVDLGLLALAVLFVVDVSSFLPHLPYQPFAVFHHAGGLNGNDETFVTLVHHDFYLAPVNDVLHGRAVLVDTYSQYGTGVLYLLAGFFQVAPLGYGPLVLLAGTLTGLQFAAAYGVLRLAGCDRALSALAVAVAIVAVAYGAVVSLADVPSAGGLRYLPAYALLVAAVAAGRWPRRARALRRAQLAIVAVASVWSLETFAMVAVTYAAVTAATRTDARRWGRDLVWGAGVAVAAVALFSLLTLALTGSRPHIRPYLAFFDLYSGGTAGILGVPRVPAWPTGIAVGALYLASAVGLAGGAGRRFGPAPIAARRADLGPWLTAVAGTTAFGAISLTYWVTHPDPRSLPPLGLPAVVVVVLWLQLARRLAPTVVRLGAGALAGWLGALLVVFAWPQAEQVWKRSAAWQALPGSPSLAHHVADLWHSPPIDPRAPAAEGLLRRHFPGSGPALVLTEPDLAVEVLLRSHRVNRLPVGDLIQDDLIRDYRLPAIDRAIARLRPGTPALVQWWLDPGVNALEQPTRLQQDILILLHRRFELRPVVFLPNGLAVVRLARYYREAGAASR